MTSIFEGQPPKTRPNFQSKQGSSKGSRYIYIYTYLYYMYLEPQTTIYKWLFQLDDEPNLYIGNGWKSPFPSIYKWLVGNGVTGIETHPNSFPQIIHPGELLCAVYLLCQVIGILAFCGPGLFNALNGLGNVGKPKRKSLWKHQG